ncbi:MAG: formate dehydrogenase accessory protein FdhE [Alphaproteobacteria bacterium]|nr:formate dehydrogenase accessory protein FdhE [Alphaproteobacteria bacterium]
MSSVGDLQPDPTSIGNIAKPPFVRLPDAKRLFAERAARLRALAGGHPLAAYLRFLADLSDAQARIQVDLPSPTMPGPDTIARARQHKMPWLDRDAFAADAAFEATIDRLLAIAGGLEMPTNARQALERLKAADDQARVAMIRDVLADAIPVEALAEHVFVAAALQVHFARMAERLDKNGLQPVGDGACPACGGPPVSSLVVGWAGAHGSRFCACSLCGTLWNYVRARCTACGSTEKISYREIDGAGGHVKAEICEKCRSYVKVLYQDKEPALDPVADDAASLGLDLMVRELGFRRAAVNPFLLGY